MADVFISYSRKDKDFVQRLDAALQQRQREAWVDWEGIRPTEEFMQAIYGAIEGADTFIFVLTPDSVASKVCEKEIAHAVAQNKRMIPLVARDVNADAVPEALAKLNWIFCRDSDDFAQATDTLISALDTDLEWVHAHTRLLTRAVEWETKGKNNSFVLRGDDLRSAERWLTEAGADKERQPTALQTEYIIASRKAAAKRQRITLGAVTFAAVVALVLAVSAFLQRNKAVAAGVAERQQRQEADRQTNIARTRLASISWNNGIKAREQSQPLLAAHHFAQAAEVFAQVADLVSSRNAQLAAEFLAGDYELEDLIEMKGKARGAVFDTNETGVAVWNYEEIDNFAGTTSLGVWDRARHAFRAPVTSLPERILGCRMSAESLLLGWSKVGLRESAIHLWESTSGKPVFEPLRFTSGDVMFSGAAFSHDGKRILCWAGAADSGGRGAGFARVHDARTGAALTPPLGHAKPLNGATFSRDESRVLTWGDDGFARVWNSTDGSMISELKMGERIAGALFSPDESRVVTWGGGSGDKDGVAQLWESRTGAALSPPLQHDLFVGGARFNADGSRLVTWSGYRYIISEGGSARVWDGKTGAPLTPHLTHGKNILGAEFSGDGKHVMTWGGDRTVRVWFISDREAPAFPKPLPHDADILNAHYTSDGASIVTITKDGAVHVWDADMGILISEAILNQQPLYHQTHTADLRSIVTCGSDGTARIWRRRDEHRFIATMRHPGMSGQQLSPDASRLLTWDFEGGIRIWETATGKEMPIRKQPKLPESRTIRSVVFSPDQHRVLVRVGSNVNLVPGGDSYILDANTGERVGSALPHEGEVAGAVFSADGSRILTWSKSWNLERPVDVYYARVWNASTGLPVTPSIKHEREILQANFTTDARAVLTFDGETMRAWDAEMGNTVTVPSGLSWHGIHGDRAFHGNRLAVSGEDGISLKDASTGRIVRAQSAARGAETFFSPDGSRLFVVFKGTGETDQSVAEVWESATGKVISRLQGEKPGFGGAAFSADSRKLLTWGSLDGAAHFWDSDTGQALFPPLHDGSQKIAGATLTADEKRIVTNTASPEGTLRVWDAGTGEPLSAPLKAEVMYTRLAGNGTRLLGHSFYRAEVRDGRSGQLILPTLRLRWPNDDVYRERGGEMMSEDGSRFVDWNGAGRIRVWNLRTDDHWPRDRLRLRLEAQTGTRLNSFDEIELLTREEWRKAKAACEEVR